MSNQTTSQVVAKLWNLNKVLQDDGVTYTEYVTELTYLLFLKMAKEKGIEHNIPEDCRWDSLEKLSGNEQLKHYKNLLLELGNTENSKSSAIQEIYTNASSIIKKPVTLKILVSEIDKLDWYTARQDGLGDLYEGLLQKNAEEKKSGAGQYFTPRALIDSMVAVSKPQLKDIIQDPAAGTGGFLIAAKEWLSDQNDIFSLNEVEQKKFYQNTFYGMEHVQDTHRLALMNLILHGIDSYRDSGGIHYGDTMSSAGEKLPKATLILTNPPFGKKKGGGLPTRKDFTYPTPNKQLCFLQHIYRGLQPGGRAAVVLPDNVLYEEGVGQQIRKDLMEKCDLHTILRLPNGIFYAKQVNTSVLFFRRGKFDTNNTKKVWIYDLRTNSKKFTKKKPLKRSDFNDFESKYGSDPNGLSERVSDDANGRWRCFSKQDIALNEYRLDITWMQEDCSESEADLASPQQVTKKIITEIEDLLSQLKSILQGLPEEQETTKDQLTNNPPGWCDFCLNDLGGTSGGKTPSKSNSRFWEDGTINWTSPKDMKRFELYSSEEKISIEALTNSGIELLPCETILMVTRSGILDHTFPVGITKEKTTINQDIKAVTPVKGINSRYLAYLLKSLETDILDNCSKEGTTVPSIETKLLEEFDLPLAPEVEQNFIAAKLDELIQKTEECQAKAQLASDRINTQLGRALLNVAFRGELVPQDPYNEPASVLLERIKNQRQAEAAAKKATKRGRKKKADSAQAQFVIPEGIADNHLAKVLEECGALSERALLAASELEPGVFQLQLTKELKAGGLKQVDVDGEAAYAVAAWEEEG